MDAEDDLPLSLLKAKEDDDDLPLSILRASLVTKEPPIEVVASMKCDADSQSPLQSERTYHELKNVSETYSVSKCTHVQCFDEVFSACCLCLSFLCYDHFVNDSPCSMHSTNDQSFFPILEGDSSLLQYFEISEDDDEFSCLDDPSRDPDFVPEHEDDSEECDEVEQNMALNEDRDLPDEKDSEKDVTADNGDDVSLPNSRDPASFTVDGEPRETLSESGTPKKRKRSKAERETRKKTRNQGHEYITASGKKVSKKNVGQRCHSSRCADKKFSCHELTESDREEVNKGFYRSGQLSDQRKFLASHVEAKEATSKSGGRKQRTMIYHLPIGTERKRVCRQMFISTLGVAERQIRTALSKKQKDGQMEMEGRGGRRNADKLEDERKRESIVDHINKFPRMESHYCRAKSKNEFLAPGLTIPTMYDMYVADMTARKEKPASQCMYYKIFKSMGLKFFALKKDACGTCLTKMKEDPQDESFVAAYQKHVAEKQKVRQVKEEAKKMAEQDPKLCAAVFDLQQVIYTPKSHHSSIFYRRRLANYNFTIYDLHSREGRCFLWHECVAKRGTNEISTCIFKFLQEMDAEGKEEVILFCDGCVGQNKNSVLHSMIFFTLEKAKNLKRVTVNYFETNHGQNEGDCMHSVIERKINKQPEIMVPSQLATIIQMARATGKKQYHVYQINTVDVLDWKRYGQDLGFQTWREAHDGKSLVWTKVMAVSIEKEAGECSVLFKHSHLEETFSVVKKPPKRTDKSKKKAPCPKSAYASAPKLSFEKYNDLIALCSGPKPVVYQQDQVKFYTNLPHSPK